MRFDNSNAFKGYSNSFLARIRSEFGIRHVEQLAAILADDTGNAAIRELGAKKIVEELEARCDRHLADTTKGILSLATPTKVYRGQSLLRPMEHGLGLRSGYEDNSLLSFFSFIPEYMGSSHSNPESWLDDDHLIVKNSSLPTARNQGVRGTCVAFACASLVELFFQAGHAKYNGKHACPRLSTQYLFFRTKQSDPSDEEGTEFHFALDCLIERGICRESDMDYVERHDWGHKYLYDEAKYDLPEISKKAKDLKITKFNRLKGHDFVGEIQRELKKNLAVGIAIPIFKNAWAPAFNQNRGEVIMPLVKPDNDAIRLLDTSLGGHAVTVVGYKKATGEAPRAGGGHFVILNSWGEEWGKGNDDVDKPGYGLFAVRLC